MEQNSIHRKRHGATGEFVAEHLPLIRETIDRVCRRIEVNLEEDDLQAVGLYALERAAERYPDEERDVSPSVYAAHYVRAALLDSVKATSRTAGELGRLQKNLRARAPIAQSTPLRIGPIPVPLQQKKDAV
jgi:DNA-directed RNA polymerase specialized sigma subunit